jgi:ferredoxin
MPIRLRKALLGLRDAIANDVPPAPVPDFAPSPGTGISAPSTALPQGSFAALALRAARGELGEALHADDSRTDLEAYAARALANGRQVDLASEGMNLSDDGSQFWGPVDNNSSRSKAGGQVLTIDQLECISCGTCEENTTLVFEVPLDSKANVLAQDGPMDLIQDAIEACPVTCIHWIQGQSVEEHHSAGGYEQKAS